MDAVIRTPDDPARYRVFAGDQYMKIRVTDVAYDDTVLEGPAPLR
ncbi:hypothetical protein [Nonomuraea sp. SBT364]|nr:hypothetical protein [Nonomuraea sp. SBT364]